MAARGRGQPPHEPERLPHLGPLEEALPADPERDARPGERGLDRWDLGVDADEDRDLGGRRAVVDEPADRCRDQRELCVAIRAAPDRRWRAGGPGRNKPLAPALRREQAICERQDLGAAPVVVVQGHLARPGVAGGEAREERRRGAREGVDRLVLVSHDAHVVAIPEPELQEPLLERVRVLVLVDAEPRVARADRRGRDLVRLEEVHRPREHVVEVEPSGAILLALVRGPQAHEQLRRDRWGPGAGPRPVRRREETPALRPLDLVREILRGREAVAAREPPRQAPDDRDLGVEHGGRGGPVVAVGPEVPKLGEGGRVERAGGDPGKAEGRQTLGHLAGGLVGERDHQDATRVDRAGRNGVGDAMGDDPRLPRSSPGVDDERSARDPDRGRLVRIKIDQELGGIEALHRRCGRTATRRAMVGVTGQGFAQCGGRG